MNTQIKIKSLLVLGFVASLTACSPTTQLTRTWTDPAVSSASWKPFTKVLVMARLVDPTGNRIAEDKLVAQFKPGVATPSYSYLQTADTVSGDVDARLQKDGFDGLILMKLIAMDKSLNVQSSGYGGYYGYRYGGMNTTVSEDRTFMVETSVYSIVTGKMLWSGTTSTLNPGSLEKAIDDIIAADKAQLVKQGLIKQ